MAYRCWSMTGCRFTRNSWISAWITARDEVRTFGSVVITCATGSPDLTRCMRARFSCASVPQTGHAGATEPGAHATRQVGRPRRAGDHHRSEGPDFVPGGDPGGNPTVAREPATRHRPAA